MTLLKKLLLKSHNLYFFCFLQVQNEASQTSNSRSNAGGGRYTPLSALASLQPGGAGGQTPQGGSRFQTTSTYQHPFAPHQGEIKIFNGFSFEIS